jgi:hypothetical protein
MKMDKEDDPVHQADDIFAHLFSTGIWKEISSEELSRQLKAARISEYLSQQDILEVAHSWKLSPSEIQRIEQEHETGNLPPASFSALLFREASRLRSYPIRQPGEKHDLSKEYQAYTRLLRILTSLTHELACWDEAGRRQLSLRSAAHQAMPPEFEGPKLPYPSKFSTRELLAIKLLRKPGFKLDRQELQDLSISNEDPDVRKLERAIDALKWQIIRQVSKEIAGRLKDFRMLEKTAQRLQTTLASVLQDLPKPPPNRPSERDPLIICAKRLRAVYRYKMHKEPGRGRGPFARGVHRFVQAVAPEYNVTLEAIAKIIEYALKEPSH